jgi:DNA gyrase/topoisomerase IV subunit A
VTGGAVTAVPPAEHQGLVLDLSSPEYVVQLTELEGRLHVLDGLLDVSSRFHQVNEAIQFAPDRETVLQTLQQEPFSYTYRQAEAILDMPMSWQTAAEVENLREERGRLTSRRFTLRENVTEVLAFHWFG